MLISVKMLYHEPLEITLRQKMRQFIEFVPVIAFFGVYFVLKDLYVATAVLMGGVCVQVGFEYAQDKAVSKRTQVVFWVAIIAGGATLLLHDELFIKWKPTIVNWLFAAGLIITQFMYTDNLLKKMLGEHLPLPDHVWRNLNYGWALGFFIAGALNLVVAYQFSTDFWVAYKMFGGFGITMTYTLITVIYLVKGGYIKDDEQEPAKPADP